MALTGHGVDIVEVARMRRALERHGPRFAARWFGENEIADAAHLRDPAPFYASRFAAKEAFAKAVGSGFRGFGPKDVTVRRGAGGAPILEFSPRVIERHPSVEKSRFLLSIAHEKNYAVASVIMASDA